MITEKEVENPNKPERPPIPENIPDVLHRLLETCWQNDPEKRPTFAEIVGDLLRCDEMLFDDLDLNHYKKYRQEAFEPTKLTDADKSILDQKILEPREIEHFNRVKEAAESGDIHSMLLVGNMYEQGNGVRKDLAQAFHWYKKAADGGNAIAMCNTGQALLLGHGVDQNLGEGTRYIKLAAETAPELPEAQLRYARCLELGVGIEKKTPEAAEAIYTKYSETPYERPDAMYGRARVLEEMGKLEGAKEWYQKASERGVDGASCDLGLILLKERKFDDGIRYLTLASENKHPMASYNLGVIYQAKDIDKAKRYFQEAAEGGNVLACLKLSKIYLDEASKSKDEDEREKLEQHAEDLLKMARPSQHPIALYNLGNLQRKRNGNQVDAHVAALMLPAAYRYGRAALFIADILKESTKKEDKQNARKWYERAKKLGEEHKDPKVIKEANAGLASIPVAK